MDLSIESRRTGSRTVLAVTGELDVHTAGSFEEALRAVVDGGSLDIVVDLRELAFLDSTGLGVLVKGLKWTREARGSLRVLADDEKIIKVFTITGLDSAMALSRSFEGD